MSDLGIKPGDASLKIAPVRGRETLRYHAALLCQGPDQWRQVVPRFLAEGLLRGDRCVYISVLHTRRQVLNSLALQGVDAQKCLERGQLHVINWNQHYLHQGAFEPDTAMRRANRAVQRALDEGFEGLTVAGEMCWSCYRPPGHNLIMEYERRINLERFPELSLRFLCIYDRMLFDPQVLRAARLCHPSPLQDPAGQHQQALT